MNNMGSRLSYHPQCGVRFSAQDLLLLVGCGLITWALWPLVGDKALLFPIVIAHFFLFCNIFRVRRKIEYAWAIFFVANVLIFYIIKRFNWLFILLAQTPLTLALIVVEMSSPFYHGIGWRYLNPGFPERCARELHREEEKHD